MIPNEMRKSLFGVDRTEDKQAQPRENIVRAKEHLRHHQLDVPVEVPERMEKLFAKVKLPKLLGSTIEEHFENVGAQLAVWLCDIWQAVVSWTSRGILRSLRPAAPLQGTCGAAVAG
jgi:hypothetical protein